MIEVRNVAKSHGAVRVLEGVSLDVRPGRPLALVGPSGSGKTTLLRLVAGLETPDFGEILIGGAAVSKPGWALPPFQRGVGFMFQTPALWPHLTVAQNILFGLGGMTRPNARQVLATLLEQLDLKHLAARHPGQLSGGEARRVALARTLAPRPRILLFDEPLTNLDGELKARVLAVIQAAIQETRPAVIFVTHDAAEAARVASETRVLRAGRIVAGAGQPGGTEFAP